MTGKEGNFAIFMIQPHFFSTKELSMKMSVLYQGKTNNVKKKIGLPHMVCF